MLSVLFSTTFCEEPQKLTVAGFLLDLEICKTRDTTVGEDMQCATSNSATGHSAVDFHCAVAARKRRTGDCHAGTDRHVGV